MRYKIEYLTETTEEGSVCWRDPVLASTLELAGDSAWARGAWAYAEVAARGFQIRDMDRDGDIVAIEDFPPPPPWSCRWPSRLRDAAS